mgnify:CR=1 FL=1
MHCFSLCTTSALASRARDPLALDSLLCIGALEDKNATEMLVKRISISSVSAKDGNPSLSHMILSSLYEAVVNKRSDKAKNDKFDPAAQQEVS